MATYNGQDYTSFRAVNLRGSTVLRVEAGGAAGTLSADLSEGLDRAWRFPNKSGSIPIMGTFAVQFPTITSTSNVFSTIVTVSGIRSEDALVVQLNRGVSSGYDVLAVGSGATSKILNAVTPGNGQITLGFLNNGVTTGYTELIYSYLAMR